MTSRSMKSGLRTSALALALSLCFAGAANAQSTVGSVYGQTKAGDTVTLQSADTGASRQIVAGADGRYNFSQIAPGHYKVISNGVTRDVDVKINTSTPVNFAGAGNASGELGTVTVVGSAYSANAIDVTRVDTSTIFTQEQLRQLPVARDVAAVSLLAPGAVSNSSYSANAPSFGGSASSENAYYINGFPVTNPLTAIGFNTLPFDAVDQTEVLTAGYGAQYGRSTGGVVNVTTKRGSNKWHFGVGAFWNPKSMRSNPRDQFYPNTGFYPDTDGTLYLRRQENQYDNVTYGAYVSGPIVKDHLFFYVNGEMTKRDGKSVRYDITAPNMPNGYNSYTYKYPRWTTKLDWQINADHLLELTGVSDVTQYDADYSGYNYNGFQHYGAKTGGVNTKDDSKLYIGKYTGHFGENFTVSALVGRMKVNHTNEIFGYDPTCPRISGNTNPANQATGITYYPACQTGSTVYPKGEFDLSRGGRLDLEYRAGRHTLGLGYDAIENRSLKGDMYAGGFIWVYMNTKTPTTAYDASHGIGAPADAGGSGTQGKFVRRQYYTHRADVRTVQKAYYLTDKWQVTDNFLLSLGVRNENFTNYNGDNLAYITQKNQWAPRIGFSWDVNGDSTFKVFGNAGRYHLVLPNNVAVRAAAASLYTQEYFTYTGTDPRTGAPTGLVNIPMTNVGYNCPGSTTVISSNLECGSAPDPRTVAAKNMKAHYQDEFVLGMQQQLTPTVTWGARVQYRVLRSAIDDTCTPALSGACFLFNPGVGNTFQEQQADGSFRDHYYSAAELNLPKLKRHYSSLTLFAEHGLSNNWYGRAEYVFAKNVGNAEGQLNSDLDTGGGGQADVSVTQDWDLPQLMVGSYGYLPNDRRHQLKAYGFYRFSKEWQVGASTIISSGRPVSCTSYYPTADRGLYNGAYYHFCGIAGSGTAPGSARYTPPSADYAYSPRGTKGSTPWSHQLNLNVQYKPNFAQNKLTFAMDILNVMNEQVAQFYNSRYAQDRNTPSRFYRQDLNYTSPRTFRFTVRYDY